AVHPVGEAVGVRDTKGILNLVMHEVEVSTLPTNIPERIDADVSNLAIGDVLTVRDLRPPEGVRIVNDPGQAVATVSPPMAEEVAPTPEVAAAVTPAEPEVLTERKPKEEGAPAEAEGKKAPVAAAAKKPEDLVLVYDDIDMALGKVRTRLRGSAGGHNGVQSVIDALGTEAIRRVKIGIGRPPQKSQVPDHVLTTFEPEEDATVATAVATA